MIHKMGNAKGKREWPRRTGVNGPVKEKRMHVGNLARRGCHSNWVSSPRRQRWSATMRAWTMTGCLRMYSCQASDDHLPIAWIEAEGTPATARAVAPPERME